MKNLAHDFFYKIPRGLFLGLFLYLFCSNTIVLAQNDYLQFNIEIPGPLCAPYLEADSIVVFNPATMDKEYIRLFEDGRVQHRPFNSNVPVYIDNSVIYTHPKTMSTRHATFSSGLWMERAYNTTDKKPVGNYLRVSSYLFYFADSNNTPVKTTIQNCSHFTNAFDANGEDLFGIAGLPLQSYRQNPLASDPYNSEGLLYNSSEFPGLYRLHHNNTLYTATQIDAIGFGNLEQTHILPAEVNTFQYSIISNSNGICDFSFLDGTTVLEARLFIDNTASYIPISTDEYITGALIDETPHDYFEFDLQQFSSTILGGQKFFVIELYILLPPPLSDVLQHRLHIPVLCERPTEALTAFGNTTTMPIELDMVIHDPPGSQSFAEYATGTTICKTTEITIETGDGFNNQNAVQVGFSGSAGEYVSGNIELTLAYTNEVDQFTTALSNSAFETCTTLKQTISTSSEYQQGVYTDGDLFIGHSKEIQLYDGLRYFWDEDNASFYESEGIYIEIIGRRAFMKTAEDIELEVNDLCNVLETITQAGGESDEDFDFRRDTIRQAMVSWIEMIAENEAIIADLSLPSNGTLGFPDNGSSFTESEELERIVAVERTTEILTTESHGVDPTFLIAGNGYYGSKSWTTTISTKFSNQQEESSVVTNTYTLQDGPSQAIEEQTVSFHIDPRFGNKFFRVTPDSRTSCPYEGGIRIDQPNIKSRITPISPNESNQIYISGVPNGTTLAVPIDLCNLFYFNTGLTGNFKLVRESGSGYGAGVELNTNDPLENTFANGDPFPAGFGRCHGFYPGETVQNIFISQNPVGDLNYDESTDEIRIRFYSDCDEEVYDILSISVRFTTDPNAVLNMNAECEFLQGTDRAINFDGIDDQIEIKVKKQPFVFNDFSYEFWVKPEGQLVAGQTENNAIPTQSAASISGGFPFVIFPENGITLADKQVTIGVAVGTDGVQVVEHYDGSFEEQDIVHSAVALNHAATINDWTHVAVVYKKRVPTLYINGLLAKTGLRSEFLGVHPSCQLGGGMINGQANYFDGTVDDLRYWLYARTAFQIEQDMNNKLSGNEPELLSLYLFDGQQAGGANAGEGLIEYSGRGSAEDAVFYNFNYGSTASNWVDGRVAEFCACAINPCADDDMDGLDNNVDFCPNVPDIAIDFDGTNDYIEVPHNPMLNVVDGDFAFQAWVYPRADASNTIVSKPGILIYNVYGGINQGKQGLFLVAFGTGAWLLSDTSVPLNTWSHVAVSFDWATKTTTFYLNGMMDGQVDFPPFTPFNNTDTDPFYIGRQTNCNCNFFNGFLDDVIVWEKTLTPEEILASMAAPLTGTVSDLVAYYDFNDEVACASSPTMTAVDKGPNGLNGTLTNFTPSGCASNWTSGRNLDSDGDGTGDACDIYVVCQPDYANGNSLSGNQAANAYFEASGLIQSNQKILTGTSVTYDSGISIELNPGFEVVIGAVFEAFIDGCGSAIQEETNENQ